VQKENGVNKENLVKIHMNSFTIGIASQRSPQKEKIVG